MVWAFHFHSQLTGTLNTSESLAYPRLFGHLKSLLVWIAQANNRIGRCQAPTFIKGASETIANFSSFLCFFTSEYLRFQLNFIIDWRLQDKRWRLIAPLNVNIIIDEADLLRCLLMQIDLFDSFDRATTFRLLLFNVVPLSLIGKGPSCYCQIRWWCVSFVLNRHCFFIR